ncbi:uncharacterized protein L969DRAFT_66137 [Mixia osmundae IAM 14324]|uniref:N-acetyltransferase domain-containing protein n=1 Tax=Mixia osmundae (strain CBS 9802 / IAM 14324 / JCM 22182 / KY 12970) TaxID=764103 RepID=G7DUS0_MIXOS|nr:uncharacterized protein L969DRAFT_66137 [Mixia osmundae IAM 14324]KEI37452.1 hypothetical protein L969DRAFT_66137 [Mixia osmundae IAM 14324]GAA94330.1 hypothetical protein E5Q_00981 [Mixia osmundae IAM 14324]
MPVTRGGKDRIHEVAEVLTRCFHDDPVIHYFHNALTPAAERDIKLQHFIALVTAAALAGASLEETQAYSGVSIWMPPGTEVGGNWIHIFQSGLVGLIYKLGWGCKKFLFEYTSHSHALERISVSRESWYLFFIATLPEARGQGLCSRLIEPYKELARHEDKQIWLEATTEKSKAIYLHLGFRVTGEFRLGKGSAASNGDVQAGGPGVPVWGMLYDPREHPK